MPYIFGKLEYYPMAKHVVIRTYKEYRNYRYKHRDEKSGYARQNVCRKAENGLYRRNEIGQRRNDLVVVKRDVAVKISQ